MALPPETAHADYGRASSAGISTTDDLRAIAVHKVAWGAIFAGAVIASGGALARAAGMNAHARGPARRCPRGRGAGPGGAHRSARLG